MTVSHDHAVEVDTRLSQLWEQTAKVDQRLGWHIDKLHEAAGERRERGRDWRDLPWKTSTDEVLAILRPMDDPALIAAPWSNDHEANVGKIAALKAHDALKAYDADMAELATIRAEEDPLNDEFRAERWPRFFLVLNTGGHIHKDMHCKTTFPTTRWSWLPSLSGLGEDAAVAEQGPRLCSVCYPSAPVEWTLGLPAKLNPKRCPGSSQQATDIDRRYYIPRGRCPVCGTSVGVSSTGKARPHNKPA